MALLSRLVKRGRLTCGPNVANTNGERPSNCTPRRPRGRANLARAALLSLATVLVTALVISIAQDPGVSHAQTSPDLGQLAAYWLDSSGQNDHPEANGNLLRLQYCRGTLPFMVYFHGDTDHRDIDEWDVDIRPYRGVVGNVTHEFKEQPNTTDGFHQMYGRITFAGNTIMTIRIRAKVGSTWGPWSKLNQSQGEMRRVMG